MRLMDSLSLQSSSATHTIEIYEGDLTDMPPHLAVDLLIVSAFPNSYGVRNPRTLMTALYNQGISVSQLAKNKTADLRDAFACWLSAEVKPTKAGIQFKRILCFEPPETTRAPEMVAGLFRALMPFVYETPHIRSIATPLLATGSQKVPVAEMLEPLMDAAVNWLALGLPIRTIRIVEKDPLKAAEMKGAFAILKKRYATSQAIAQVKPNYAYDYFLSYSRADESLARALFDELRAIKPDVRIFYDRQELDSGAAWQQEIYAALDNCNRVIALLSPTYVLSKVCNEEYNIALLRQRESGRDVLIPLYVASAPLPSYMKLTQFTDCRERDLDKLKQAAHQLLV